jgi:hypothetical protein
MKPMDEKVGNELPKKGNSLPLPDADLVGMSYEAAIAAAVRQELGGSHQAIKTLMRRTGASARTAKNWLSGSAGPTGAHLIELMRTSDLVYEVVLELAGRKRSKFNSLKEASNLLKRAIAIVECQY